MPKSLPISETKPTVYAGTFERVMDAKHRITIPSAWLGAGSNEFHAIPNPAGDCLIVMPPEEFNSIEERISRSGLPAADQRKAIRQFYSQARAISADAQGRILFPEEQCDSLKLHGEIVLVGGRSRFEVWNTKRWAAVSTAETPAYLQVADMIGL